MRAIVLFFFISGMLTACSGDDSAAKSGGVSSQDKLQIVSSIKPIQAIVLAIAGEHADVAQLIPDYASPHDYSFKPSDIRKIEKADIVFRIDEHMETQLNGVFKNIDTNKTSIVSLAQTNGLTLLEADHRHQQAGHDDHDKEHDHKEEPSHQSVKHDDHSDAHEDDHKHDTDHKHDDDHKHDHDTAHKDGHDKHHDDHTNHENIDFHIWTSPKNAVLIANQIASNLKQLDPKNAEHYQKNIEIFFEKVKAVSENALLKLAPYKDKPYIVFHNSWQYFAVEFGLQKPIVIDLHEGVSSGAKTVSEVRDRIVKESIACVFYDSSISLARVTVITKEAKTIEIDVLAKDIRLDQSTYINWLEQFGNQVESCLTE